MDNILKENKLEELLTINWAKFLDINKLLAFILTQVRDNSKNFSTNEVKTNLPKNTKISISRFQIDQGGFIIWVEFSVYINEQNLDKCAVGTTEFYLTNLGQISHIQTLGTFYKLS